MKTVMGISEMREVEFIIETSTLDVEGGMESAGGGLEISEGIAMVTGTG